jgi:hypothetical protein
VYENRSLIFGMGRARTRNGFSGNRRKQRVRTMSNGVLVLAANRIVYGKKAGCDLSAE